MSNESLPTRLILASSSKYRKLQLQRFGIPFDCQSPRGDETALSDESPHELVARLAVKKAESISRQHPQAVVIGSDQIALFDGQMVAVKQLKSFSGQVVEFLTAVSVLCLESSFSEQYTDCTRVYFRILQDEEIERYLQQEKPYDCAGAFKAESLGIVLFERIVSEDPTALIGLPLIRTAAMLRRAGMPLP
jgi:septum formation protein